MEDMNFRAAREKGSAQTPAAGLGPVDNENGCYVITRIDESYLRGTDRPEAVVRKHATRSLLRVVEILHARRLSDTEVQAQSGSISIRCNEVDRNAIA